MIDNRGYGRVIKHISANEFEQKLEYKFKDKNLLKKALTHTSFFSQKEKGEINHFQRLEFLGDSVLNLVVSKYLYNKFPFSSEGELSKLKSVAISQSFLAKLAKQIKLDKYIVIGKGVDLKKGRGEFSILADCLEACLGAVFLDGGIDNCEKIIHHMLNKENIELITKSQIGDFKTYLQELSQRTFHCLPSYQTIKETGLEHQKTFYMQVYIGTQLYGIGSGKNKKEAEQNAAYYALKKLKIL
ncbi:MAG: ribonuclease III [Candidatus Atribacteria bacterium]|nr:ribonuclease III [Candidatus Atribacteria bacterium]